MVDQLAVGTSSERRAPYKSSAQLLPLPSTRVRPGINRNTVLVRVLQVGFVCYSFQALSAAVDRAPSVMSFRSGGGPQLVSRGGGVGFTCWRGAPVVGGGAG